MTDFFTFISNEWLLVSGFLAFLYAYIFYESRKAGKTIGHHEITRLLNSDSAIVLDLRDPKEFKAGHVAGAINFPFSQLEQKINDLHVYKNKIIILTDKLGQHSSAVAKRLKKAEFDTRRMRGGMTEWVDQNLPLVKE